MNSNMVVSISWDTMVERLLRIHRCFPFVTLPQKLNMMTSSCWATTKLTRDAMVMRSEDPNTASYCSCMPQLSLGGMIMHSPIITNRSTSITVAMLTKRDASARPKTSPIMSVTRKSTGTKKMPTDTLMPAMDMILVPRVLTMTIDATKRARRKSRFR